MSPSYPRRAGKLPLVALCLAAACTAFSLSTARADDAVPSDPGPPVGAVNLPPGHSASEVKAALVSAFVGRGWTIKSASDSAVLGHLLHRGVDAYLTAEISGDVVNFYSQAWKVDHLGNHVKPDLPSGWINYIKQDLVKDLLKASGHP